MASSSLSSSSFKQEWTYDVFLSFRGEDTRNNFVDHLYDDLNQEGISTFKDDKMVGGGQPISEELVKAIKVSRFAVVVFSKNYANSWWCLEELSKIMECHGQMGLEVLPVFYHVDPSDVRKALQRHEVIYKGETDRVNKWREALIAAAGLSGYHISNVHSHMNESRTIRGIVKWILNKTQPHTMEENLVGMSSHIDALTSLLCMEATQVVRTVGIWGMGGIGKTTIAGALFRRILFEFGGSSFVRNVRENSSSEADICILQENILNNIHRVDQAFKIHDTELGAFMLKTLLCKKKVLLVLDDVDDVKQLEFLAASHEWFGPGSRIIITTRDKHLLSDLNPIYKPALLRMDQAVDLFSRYAFRKNSPPDGYEKLSYRAIQYADRLPLALKVLGSFFHGRKVSEWQSALDRLSNTPNTEIFETLKLSFDGLCRGEKEIFLDIACFFRGKDIKHVTRVLESLSFRFYPVIGIKILIQKSLITISNNRIDMHDLIQAMGWQIVREISPNTRLWRLEEVHDFRKNWLRKIEAIVVPNKQYNIHQKLGFSADVFFKRMRNLQLLDVYRKFTSCEPTILPGGLRWLSWNQYPFSSLPLADKCELVGIEMHGGNIEHLWTGRKIMRYLKFLHLQRLDCLTMFPDVSEAPFIERLVLTYCRNLVEVHESLGYHKKLIYVDVSDCWKLNSFPSRIEMDSLETLIMSRCSSLEQFPEVTLSMINLSNICLDDSRIEKLPSSIGYLCSLSCLNLTRCTSLKNIPNSICELKCLTSLHLDDCVELLTLPEEFGSIENLEELRLGFTDSYRALQRLPQSINFYSLKSLCSLRKLDLSWRQTKDKDFPEDLHAFSLLEELNLSGYSELTELPASIYHLSHLKHLELNDCYKLQNLHSLPSGLQVLRASGCTSLKMIEDLPEKYEWLYKIWLVGCWKLPDQEDETKPSKMLLLSFLKKCAAVGHRLSIAIPGNKIPSWFKQQQHGYDIPIKLPPRWHSQVMGFAISCVFNSMWKMGRDYPVIKFRIVNDGEFVPLTDILNPISHSQISFVDGKTTSISKPQNRMKSRFSEVDYIYDTTSSADIDTVWIGYVPFGSFENMCDDWSGMEGNLAISIKLKTGQLPVRCGAHIVYKDDLESIPQTKTCISDYWKLECVCRVGQSFIYEDEFRSA